MQRAATLIGIDTNVLVRYIMQDDPERAAAATVFLEDCSKDAPGYVSHMVVCELAWVLRQSYHYPKRIVLEVLKQLLVSEELRFERPNVLRAALHGFAHGPADIADYLIARRHYEAGCAYTVTFDRRASRHTLFRLLGGA